MQSDTYMIQHTRKVVKTTGCMAFCFGLVGTFIAYIALALPTARSAHISAIIINTIIFTTLQLTSAVPALVIALNSPQPVISRCGAITVVTLSVFGMIGYAIDFLLTMIVIASTSGGSTVCWALEVVLAALQICLLGVFCFHIIRLLNQDKATPTTTENSVKSADQQRLDHLEAKVNGLLGTIQPSTVQSPVVYTSGTSTTYYVPGSQ